MWNPRVASSLRPMVGLVIFALVAVSARALDPSSTFTEDFSTTAYRDAVFTTAIWDTGSGQLRLPAFALSTTGSLDTPGSAANIAIDGNFAYVADGVFGLQVVDITDPANPVLLGTYDTPFLARGVDVDGDLVFVADQTGGLLILDVSHPTAPALVGTYDTPGFARDVEVAGRHAFVADGASGFQIISISDPSNPALVGSYDTPDQAFAVAVAGDHVLVADQLTGILVMDINDPADPNPIGSFDTAGGALDVEVAGDLAFVADGNAGLVVLDISDPTTPLLAGSYDTPSTAQAVAVAGDRVVVADGFAGLLTFDILDPTTPILTGTQDTPGFAQGVAMDGGLAFVGDAGSGLRVIRVSNPTSLHLVGSYDPLLAAGGVTVAGDHAYMAEFNSGLVSFDISDPANPTLLDATNATGNALDVAVTGDIAVVAFRTGGVSSFDVSDPSSLTLLATRDTPGTARGIDIDGDYAFVADELEGLRIISIVNPSFLPTGLVVDTPGEASDVAVAGQYAYVADWGNGLVVVDISDITSPTIVATYFGPTNARGIAVAGDFAYLAVEANGLWMVDISDPLDPVGIVGMSVAGDDARRVAVSGNRLIVAHSGSPLGSQIFDITNLAPVRLEWFDTPGGRDVVIAGDRAYVADGGLTVLQLRNGEVAEEAATAQSLDVDPGTDPIVRARIHTAAGAGVSWDLSSDAGLTWWAAPEGVWTRIEGPGSDLRWRAGLTWSAVVNPVVDELTVEWLDEFAPIASIADIPDDQGGWLRMEVCRSAYDFADEIHAPVAGYQAYRRVDDPLLKDRIVEEGQTGGRGTAAGFDLAPGDQALRRLGDREFVLADGFRKVGQFPPGTWEIVGTIMATQQDSYSIAVPTLADSTAQGGPEWSVHLVTTHTTTPSLWFVSEPDSGVSVDNLAPMAPANLQFGGPAQLSWDAPSEADFGYHSVFGSENATLDPTALLIDHTVSPGLDVTGQPFGFFHVTTSDHAGNQSGAASIASVPTSVRPEGPGGSRFFLHPATPNPFHSGTSIEFELPRSESVRLTVFDARGRKVRAVVNEPFAAGRHRVSWDGVDHAGRPVASGTYFARIRAGGFQSTKRLTVLR